MLRKTGGFTLALGLLLATQASAETYEVSLMGPGFFPTVTYTQTGDVINFHNLSDQAATISAVDGSWSTGTMEPHGIATIVIVEGMTQEFENIHAKTQYTQEEIDANVAAQEDANLANETSETFIENPSPLFASGKFEIGTEIPIVSAGDGAPITMSEASSLSAISTN